VAGRLTLWGAGELLQSFFSQNVDPPPSFWLALIKDIPPTPYISGSELDEPVAAEYARVEIVNDEVNWTNDGQIQTMVCEAELSYVEALEDWGTIRYWALCNAEVEGYVYFVGEFENPEIIATGDTVEIAPGDLTVSLGPFYFVEA